jgi:hypothetical protein
MTYRIEGLSPEPFAPLFDLSDDALAAHRAVRVLADDDHGFPCRVSLQDARAGEELILLHHLSHDAETPYRSAYAIYVRKVADTPAVFIDEIPPVFQGRLIALRAFDAGGMLKTAVLTAPGETDAGIRRLFDQDDVDYIHAHNAAYGCYAARVIRA